MTFRPPPRWQPHIPEQEDWPGAPGAWDECARAAERDTPFAAVAWAEPPDTGWGAVRLLTVALDRLGYGVSELRLASGEVRLLLR